MAVSYSVSKASTTIVVTYRATGPVAGIYTYNQRYGFIPFDLVAAGVAAGTVESAELILRCTTVVGGGQTIWLRSSGDPNGFGATLDATQADWQSSRDFDHDTVVVHSTGVYSFNVDPAGLIYTGLTYFSLFPLEQGGAVFNQSASFNSNDAGTPSNRPVLRLTLFSGQVIFVQIGHN